MFLVLQRKQRNDRQKKPSALKYVQQSLAEVLAELE